MTERFHRYLFWLKLMPWGRRMTPLLWTFLGWPFIEKKLEEDVDLVHAVSLGYPIATRKKYLTTIHDIGPLTHPEYFPKRTQQIMSHSFQHAIKKSDGFIGVSLATVEEVLNYADLKYKVNLSDRIHLVMEGVDEIFFESVQLEEADLNRIPIEKDYFLAVGKISPRKNLDVVFDALAQIKDKLDTHLITVGGDGWDFEQIKKRTVSLGLEGRVHFLGYVSDQVLMYLYQHAKAFIYPSKFEGFGLPVLEAMASGCPVVTSNLSSLPEVAGDAAILINPDDASELSEELVNIVQKEELRSNMTQKGLERAKLFSWRKVAFQTTEVYRKLI